MSNSGFAAVAARLIERAALLGEAAAQAARTAQRDPARVWRTAQLLWPTFTKG